MNLSKLEDYLKTHDCYVSYMDYHNDEYRIVLVNRDQDEVYRGSGKSLIDALDELSGKI
jgi:hypothetical protein